MAGGVINNGIGSTGVNSIGGVVIPTMVRLSSDLLSYWTSMTCLYDPLWVPDIDRATLPIAMMHVTGIQESGTSQVSKKRVILYEPQSDNDVRTQADIVRPSVMRSIADNIVREPRTYTINAVLPFQPLGRYVREGIGMLTDAIAVFMALLGTDQRLTSGMYDAMSVGSRVANMMSDASAAITKLPSVNDVTYINKQSLDAMWEKSHLLCMKMWTGYDYKFVAITNMTVEKKPIEDDVFRVTLQVQEMPVLTTNAPKNARIKDARKLSFANAVSMAQGALSSPLISLMGVRGASGVKTP